VNDVSEGGWRGAIDLVGDFKKAPNGRHRNPSGPSGEPSFSSIGLRGRTEIT